MFYLKRILQAIPTLIGVTLITFTLFYLVGGDPAFQLAGKHASPELINEVRSQLGTDRPIHHQYLSFLTKSLACDWGYSWQTNQKVNHMILSALLPTISLTVPAFFIALLISILISLASINLKTSEQISWINHLCLLFMSVSLLVYIIIAQYFLAYRWNLFPVGGWSHGWSNLSFLLLPWLIWIFVSIGPNVLLLRKLFLQEQDKDYIKTARAKGLRDSTARWRHILSNSSPTIVTLISMQLPFLITGSLLLESFFSIPGMGSILIDAIQSSDLPVIQAITVLGSLIYITLNILCDFVYSFLDPRVALK
jgi:peptide/nickel transport system permease protein